MRNVGGGGSGASPLVCGWTDSHQDLPRSIAAFESTEAAVLFPSGYAACSGTIATLAEAGDLILSDRLNHASLIDGCRLSRADCRIYPHRDCETLAAMLEQVVVTFIRRGSSPTASSAWMVMSRRWRSLCDLAERYDASLIVDEAHGTGVLGSSGSGVCEAMGVKDRVAIRIGTLSKAIGSQGGFVAAPSS